MQDKNAQSLEPAELAERLHDIVDQMLAPFGKQSPRGQPSFWNPHPTPFDITKLNEHDTKAEFLREKKAVEACYNGLKKTSDLLVAPVKDKATQAMRNRLRHIIDQKMRSNAPQVSFDDAFSLVRRNVTEVGGHYASLMILLDFSASLKDRLAELNDQEKKFWDVPNRAPDHYARAIALRLAKLFARETGQVPTIGSSGHTGDPSTGYSRALKEVFKLLGITTGVKNPAEWAIGQLTDEDLTSETEILGGLLGLLSRGEQSQE